MSFNRVILMGNLTRDVELKHLQSGTVVAELGLAVTNRRKTANGAWVEEPVFVDVSFFGKRAEALSQHFSKGSPILIEGHLKFETWKTSDGEQRNKLKVVGQNWEFAGRKAASPDETSELTTEPVF